MFQDQLTPNDFLEVVPNSSALNPFKSGTSPQPILKDKEIPSSKYRMNVSYQILTESSGDVLVFINGVPHSLDTSFNVK
jgi:hypothetical protein